MKIVRILISVAVVFFLVVWGISSFLTTDDLAGCGDTPSSKKGCGAADAIVAVSGGDTLARADEAIKLYKSGWATKLIFSGAAADKSGPSNARVMQQRAIDEGVDAYNIIVEETSETTKENAEKTADIFTSYNIQSAVIVTSAYHERRAMLEFERVTPQVELRGHPVSEDKQWGPFWWITPTGWILAVPEVVHCLILSVGGVDRT